MAPIADAGFTACANAVKRAAVAPVERHEPVQRPRLPVIDAGPRRIGVDAGKLKTAVSNLRANKRSSTDDKVFGDVIAKLIDASEQDTVKAMTVLKKVHAEEE